MALQRKIASINLTTKKIELTDIPAEWRRNYIGGQGLAAFLLHHYAPPGCDPLSPENPVIISAGIMGGTIGIPATQTCITTKSPLTNACLSVFLDGHFASELRWAGFDHLVITGKAKRPVYLLVQDGTVGIQDASGLRGCGTGETQRAVRDRLHDQEIQILTTGSAGEKRVRFAHVLSSIKRTTDRPGAGAVFGAKNLKAVACRGGLDIEIKHADEAILCGRRIIKAIRKMENKRSKNTATTPATPAPYQETANEYGIDLETTGALVDWVRTLYTHRILERKQVSRVIPESGAADPLLHLIQGIADRKGLGDILAEGPLKASESFGGDCLRYYTNGKSRLYATVCLQNRAENVPSDILTQLYTDRALGCLGIPPRYHWLLQPKHAAHEDFLELIRLNTGTAVSYRKLRKVAKRCVIVEQLFNRREGISPDTGAAGAALFGSGDWDSQGVPTDRILEKLNITELRQPRFSGRSGT